MKFIFFKSSEKWFENCPVRLNSKTFENISLNCPNLLYYKSIYLGRNWKQKNHSFF